MATAPPGFLPVLLGHGSFLKNEYGRVRLDEDGNPLYLIPTSDNFLEMKPSKEAQQFWPADPTRGIPNKMSVVLLSINANTLCKRADVVTEVGYTVYDTASIYDGTRGQKKKLQGCLAPGPRGDNITKFAHTRHFIVKDTAHHHPGTCDYWDHTAQPYHFTYRKSEFIDRTEILKIIEQAFNQASCHGLTPESLNRGHRRAVVLVGWGDEELHPQIKASFWYRNNKHFQHWDMKHHQTAQRFIVQPSYLHCLDVFGIQHRAYGKEIGHNAGNRTAFTIQLLIGLCFLTQEQYALLRLGLDLEPGPKFPGVESVLARDNRPPGSGDLPRGRVPIMH
ncbi:hypothetical protein F5Y14DRAFT_442280 [Nemania sp. NC0429]|nr:hypothetical protein F5Y14DRAFT_442280 [Nemania sp. NC0429]